MSARNGGSDRPTIARRSRTGPSRAALGLWFALVVSLSTLAGAARAEEAPADSALGAYVRSLSDSTDSWFGSTAAPLDTTGLDSALVAGLAKPPGSPGHSGSGSERRKLSFGYGPALGFNRVDGAQLGGTGSMSVPRAGQLSARAQYTTGTHDLLGEGAWTRSWGLERWKSRAVFKAAAGRWTEAFDRDHFDPFYATFNALAYGGDRHQYVRRDGFRASLRVGRDRGSLTAQWRDQLESALPYTTDWVLFGGDPVLPYNTAAALGRAREWSLHADAGVPGTRFRVNGHYWTSDPRIGSDFRYRRYQLSSGGDISLGQHFALVPQFMFGRLRGDALPQEALFLGGVSSLRTLDRNQLAATGRAFARADLVLVDDLRDLLHLPLPAWLPLQSGAFVASGAAWGRDPVSGAAVATLRDAPHREEWLSEAGIGLSWRPGIPDPLMSLRLEYAWPIGPDDRDTHWTIAFQRLVNVMPGR